MLLYVVFYIKIMMIYVDKILLQRMLLFENFVQYARGKTNNIWKKKIDSLNDGFDQNRLQKPLRHF